MNEEKVRNTSLRLTREIRNWLTSRAQKNCRSFNGEITMLLKQQMEKDQEDKQKMS
ncbi:Arc family DNA-binding protein [Aeromonas caviae]|uniref:Arc family DNA-binding protein n=1 Tax=Aeromonas caviae TaxID=648 RepID=UPI00397775A0